MLENRKLTSELVITRNVKSWLKERIINLEKKQVKGEQYSRRYNVEVSGIPNSVCNEGWENTAVNIWKEILRVVVDSLSQGIVEVTTKR